MKLATHRVFVACLTVAAIVPCCLAAGNGIDNLGLNALLSGIGNLFQKGDNASPENNVNNAASEPVALAETTNTEEPQQEDVVTPTTSAAVASFDILGGLGPLGNDATVGFAATESLDLPRSVETVVRTQILVVAPDRIKEVVFSEPLAEDDYESASAAADPLLACQCLLISFLPIALAFGI
ncbi:hypothetical protein LPJ81_001806 [Coemansia sp. IMI 209127]|nr:hypothetical protein LPJ81_001806 [Coemansia sp. IMI 209127]